MISPNNKAEGCEGHICENCGDAAEIWHHPKGRPDLRHYWCSHTCKLKALLEETF